MLSQSTTPSRGRSRVRCSAVGPARLVRDHRQDGISIGAGERHGIGLAGLQCGCGVMNLLDDAVARIAIAGRAGVWLGQVHPCIHGAGRDRIRVVWGSAFHDELLFRWTAWKRQRHTCADINPLTTETSFDTAAMQPAVRP